MEKKRGGSKVVKTCDRPQTPCGRLLACRHVCEETKEPLRGILEGLDPLTLAAQFETKLQAIVEIIGKIEDWRAEERWRAGETESSPTQAATAGGGCVAAPVAIAPCASTPLRPRKPLPNRP